MTFSKRQGIEPMIKPMQLTSMDDDLRNSLWNVFYKRVLTVVQPSDYEDRSYMEFREDFAVKLHKIPIDEVIDNYWHLVPKIKTSYMDASWNKVYDLIDFFLDKKYVSSVYINEIDNVLRLEFSGYRVINKKIVPISNDLEAESISNALHTVSGFDGYEGVKIHLSKALSLLSDRINPDYGNSIKESISAVESLTKKITGESSLGNALNKLKKSGVEINNQLKESFIKVYAFSNGNESGIRHAVVEQHKPADFETAQYLLVTCSAFINYIISLNRQISQQQV